MNVPLKDTDLRGWLRRKSGLMKIWSRRWFVLTDRFLFMFLHDDDKKSQDCIILDGQIIVEPPLDPSDPQLVYFDIVTEDEKNPSETLSLCAETEEEKKIWVRALKRVLYAEKGGALFSQSLEEILYWEHRAGRHIPYIVDECVEYLYKYGLDVEGIFRLPGRQTVAKDIMTRFERGQKVRFEDDGTDVHVVASVLKTFLRSLPDSIIPCGLFQRFMNIGLKYSAGKDEASMEPLVLELKEAMKLIPKDNYTILKYICRFLREVGHHESTNKMSMMSIGTVFSYNILRHIDVENNQLFLLTADLGQNVVFMLLQYYTQVFSQGYSYIEDGRNNNTNENLLRMSRTIDIAVLLPDVLDTSSGLTNHEGFGLTAGSSINDSTVSSELVRISGDCVLLAEHCDSDSFTDKAGDVSVLMTGVENEPKRCLYMNVTEHSENSGVAEHVDVSGDTEQVSVSDDTELTGVIENVDVSGDTKQVSGVTELTGVIEHVDVSGDTEQVSGVTGLTGVIEHVDLISDTEQVSVKGVTEFSEVTGVTEHFEVPSITEPVEVTGVTEHIEVASITEHVEVTAVTEHVEVTTVTEHVEVFGITEHAAAVCSYSSSSLTEDFNTTSLCPRQSKARLSRNRFINVRRRPQTIHLDSGEGVPQGMHSPGGINSEDVLSALALINSPTMQSPSSTSPVFSNDVPQNFDYVTLEIAPEVYHVPQTDYSIMDLKDEVTALKEELSQHKNSHRAQIATLKAELACLNEKYEHKIEAVQTEYRSRISELENKLSEEKNSCAAVMADTIRLQETFNKYKMLYGGLP